MICGITPLLNAREITLGVSNNYNLSNKWPAFEKGSELLYMIVDIFFSIIVLIFMIDYDFGVFA
jgi:hypothetical protein